MSLHADSLLVLTYVRKYTCLKLAQLPELALATTHDGLYLWMIAS
jgi:hypothetical protein